MKIRTRLSLALLLVVGAVFYKLVDWTVGELRPRYLEAMEASMLDTATLLASSLEQQIRNGVIQAGGLRATLAAAQRRRFEAQIYEVEKKRLDMRVYVTDQNGIVVYDSANGRDEGKDYSRWNDVMRTLRGEYGARATRTDPKDAKTQVLYVAAPVRQDGEIVGALTVCKPVDSVTLFVSVAQKKFMVAGLIAALAVIVFGIAVSSWITHPIQKLTDYARAVRDGRRARMPPLGRSEIGQLGAAFEEMRVALEGKQYAENYIQTLTHEMKSPLSAIRGAAELLDEEMPSDQKKRFLDNIRTESNRMQDLIDRLLQLSSIEKRRELNDVERIDLDGVVRSVVESVQPAASARAITLAAGVPAGHSIQGERFLVRQSIANLLQNAIEFCPDNGRVDIGLDDNVDTVTIRVTNDGDSIPDYALDKVFDRFYSLRRPTSGKKSSGLGLTFVREVAALHGGHVALANARDRGVTASLTFPRQPALPAA